MEVFSAQELYAVRIKTRNVKEYAMSTILLYDSHPIILTGIRGILEGYSNEYTFLQTSDLNELLRFLDSGQVDIVLTGLNEKPLLTAGIIRKYRKIPWIVLYNDNLYKLALSFFMTGARGILSKSSNALEAQSCFLSVVNGNTYICGRTTRLLADDLLSDHHSRNFLHFFLHAGSKQLARPLTRREREVANLLLKGLRTSEIAQKLNLKLSTISTMKRTIFDKKNVTNILELANQSDNGHFPR